MSPIRLEELPDEIVMEILNNLEIKDLINCGLVSKKIRAISQIEFLWQKMNLFRKAVPTKFLTMVIKKGCKYLSLSGARLEGKFYLMEKSNLKYLDLSWCTCDEDIVLEEILASCHTLKKLSLKGVTISSNMVDRLQDFLTKKTLNKSFSKILFFILFHCSQEKSVIQIDIINNRHQCIKQFSLTKDFVFIANLE